MNSKKKPEVKDINQLVLVEWIDAEAECSWADIKDALEWGKKLFKCREVGWVLEDTKDMLILTSQLGDENLIGNRSKIPKPWLLSKQVLSWTKPKSKKKS